MRRHHELPFGVELTSAGAGMRSFCVTYQVLGLKAANIEWLMGDGSSLHPSPISLLNSSQSRAPSHAERSLIPLPYRAHLSAPRSFSSNKQAMIRTPVSDLPLACTPAAPTSLAVWRRS
jgi:hypothetical protein